jgi:NAD(P)-dependent dehydrogenase (short-subunit alcohol dehydrogenase family)
MATPESVNPKPAPGTHGRFHGRRALVTGGSSGIGRAVAVALIAEGAHAAILARTPDKLRAVATETGAVPIVADLSSSESGVAAATEAITRLGGVDILVLSSGHHLQGRIDEVEDADFRRLFDANLFGPTALVRHLLPPLIEARGDILFINSSVTRAANLAERAHYAAGFQAFKALADGLRDEVNGQGVRVASVYPGRTATPRQEYLYELEGRPYRPDLLLQPEDVANIALSALALPPTAEATDIYIRPRFKG